MNQQSLQWKQGVLNAGRPEKSLLIILILFLDFMKSTIPSDGGSSNVRDKRSSEGVEIHGLYIKDTQFLYIGLYGQSSELGVKEEIVHRIVRPINNKQSKVCYREHRPSKQESKSTDSWQRKGRKRFESELPG